MTKRERDLRAALERSMVAVDDWLNLYAPECCNQERVDETKARVSENGTLAYIADVQQQSRNALENESTEDKLSFLNVWWKVIRFIPCVIVLLIGLALINIFLGIIGVSVWYCEYIVMLPDTAENLSQVFDETVRFINYVAHGEKK